ncbi:hypothetical protein ACVR1G_06555 [Streptococcus dentasini]
MFSFVKNWVHRYPEQAFLVIFNTGIFAWLHTTGSAIANQLGLAWDKTSQLPTWLTNLTHNSLASLQNFFGHTAWTWLIISMLLTVILRFIRGLFKLILFVFIVGAGLYLVYRHQTILGQLPG